jgi:PAS domain S-box-containing protein
MKVHHKTKEKPGSHKLQLELKPGEQHLPATYEHAPIGIVECSPQGMHINVNEEFCRITGYQKEELLARTIKDISFPGDYEEEGKLYEQLMAGEIASYKLEKRYIRKDGGIIYMQVIRWCVCDAAGNPLYTVGMVQDITEQKQAETQNEFQARLLESVHDAIIATNDKWQITYWNRAAEELYGWTAAEVVGKPILEITRSELTPEQRNSVREQIGKENSSSVETIHHHRDGHAIQVEASGIALHGDDGQLTGYVTSVHNITQRKQAEKALRESEELMRRAFAIETVGIIFFKTDGLITDANQAFLRMSGYSQEDVQQGRARWDVMTPPEFLPASHIAIHELLTKGETTPYEKQYIRKDGSRWWGLFAAKRITENEGVEFILDITERKQTQEALERLNLELETRVQIRTSQLQAANQALVDSHKNLQALSQRLVEVQEEERRAIARELHDRVGQSLLALKINLSIISGQLSGQGMEPVNERLVDSINLMSEINKLVRDVMTDLRPAVLDDYGLEAALDSHIQEFRSRYDINIRFEKSDPPLPRLSPSLEITLLRIAQEALFNVVKHAHADQSTLSLRQENAHITLSVEDNGIGIPSTQDANRPDGNGLKIMRERAEAFGGTLRVTSIPGQGTKIEAVIPLGVKKQNS